MRNVCATLLPIVSFFFLISTRLFWNAIYGANQSPHLLFNCHYLTQESAITIAIYHLASCVTFTWAPSYPCNIYIGIYTIYILYACNSSSVKTCTLKLFSLVARAMNETRCNSGQLNKHWPNEKTSCKLQIINVAKKRLKLVFNMSTSKAIIIFDSVNVSPIY